MTYSLIVGTINRADPLASLLDSLVITPEAAAGVVQVIVADQNPDNRLEPLLARFREPLQIRHVRSEPGLSRARNVALKEAAGDIVGFPDDDCVYAADTLTKVGRLFEAQPHLDGFSGRAVSLEGRPYLLRWPHEPEPISKGRVWQQALSISLFVRRKVVERVGPFDESLGQGSGTKWGSGEETDYVLRALGHGFHLRYDPSIQVSHPAIADRFHPAQRERAFQYARGMGRVLRKHDYPALSCLKHVIRPAMGSILYLAQGQVSGARYYARVARGRLEGWLST